MIDPLSKLKDIYELMGKYLAATDPAQKNEIHTEIDARLKKLAPHSLAEFMATQNLSKKWDLITKKNSDLSPEMEQALRKSLGI